MSAKLKLTAIFITLILFQFKLSAQETTSDTLSLSLSQARDYALKNNYKMKNARLDVTAADKKVWETTAIGLPHVDGKIDYNNNLIVGTMPLKMTQPDGSEATMYIQMGSPHTASGSISVSQLIFDGSYIVGLQSAQTYKKISELAEKKSETLIDEAVTNAYGGVILSKETVIILNSNVETLERNLKETKAYFENGLSEEQNVEQLQILLSSTKNLLFNAERAYDTNMQMLKFTLGMDINSPLKLEDGIEQLLLENINPSIVEKQLSLENNIDILIQNNRVKSQVLLKKLEKSKYLPSINAFYNTKQDAFSNDFSFFQSSQEWYGAQVVGLSLNVPIFSSFQRHSKVQQAKIELEKARTTRVETEQQLILDVEKSKNAYLSSVNQFHTAKDNMDLATKIRKKEEIKYFEGMSGSLDLSNAETQMFNTQSSYIQSIFALIQSKAALDRMLMKFEEE